MFASKEKDKEPWNFLNDGNFPVNNLAHHTLHYVLFILMNKQTKKIKIHGGIKGILNNHWINSIGSMLNNCSRNFQYYCKVLHILWHSQ